jgi:hypothetical protein
MAYKFISGPLLNTLGRCVAAASPTPIADTNYPVSQLYDGVAALPFRFGTSTSDAVVKFDLNLLNNPGFEITLSTTSTSGWLAVSGSSMTNSTAYANSGTNSIRVNGMAYHDVQVRPSEGLKFQWSMYDGTGSSADLTYIQIQCMDLGQYLTSSGGWSAATTTYVTQTTGAGGWKSSSLTFNIPGLSELLQDTATLRVSLVACSSAAYFDDILLYPGISWVSAHGHNWTTVLSPEVEGSSNDSSYTSVKTLSLYRDVALGTFSTAYYRYWKFILNGTPYAAPYCGELVFGQYDTLLENPMYGSTVQYQEKQVRKESPAGTQYVYNRGGQSVRTLKMTFYYSDSTQYYQSRRSVFRSSRGGERMIAISASDMDTEQVVYGRITETANYVKTDGVFWTVGYDVVEDALPLLRPDVPAPVLNCPEAPTTPLTFYWTEGSESKTVQFSIFIEEEYPDQWLDGGVLTWSWGDATADTVDNIDSGDLGFMYYNHTYTAIPPDQTYTVTVTLVGNSNGFNGYRQASVTTNYASGMSGGTT